MLTIHDFYDSELMLQDEVLLKIDRFGTVRILECAKLPVVFRFLPAQILNNSTYFIQLLDEWLSGRMLDINRENAKLLLKSANFENYDIDAIALILNGVSLTDHYWLRLKSRKHLYWKDVNIFDKPFNNLVFDMALKGSNSNTYIDSQNFYPEIVSLGVFPKAVKRCSDGYIYMYKGNSTRLNHDAVSAELLASSVAEFLGLDAVRYISSTYKDTPVSKCKLLTNDQTIMLDTFLNYVTSINLKKNRTLTFQDTVVIALKELKELDTRLFYEYLLLDGVMSNSDRHFKNWGIRYNTDTCNIIGLHSIFDNNLALTGENHMIQSQMLVNASLLQGAIIAIDALNMRDKLKDLQGNVKNQLVLDNCTRILRA